MRDYPILHLDTNVNKHERVSNITLRHTCKWTWESIQYYTSTQMWMNMREYPILHLDTNVN
jgi:hypothetical protein